MGGNPDLEETLSSLQSVTHGALVSIVGIVLERGILFATTLVLTHGLGVNLYGVYAFGERLIQMLRGVAHLGTSPALIRYLPEYDDSIERQNGILGLTYVTSIGASLAIATALIVFAPRIDELTVDHPLFVDSFRVFALLLPAEVLTGIVVNHFRSRELIEYQISIGKFARPAVYLAAIVLALALGYSLVGVVAGVAAAALLVWGGSFLLSLLRTPNRPSTTGWRREVRGFYDTSFPIAFSSIGNVLASRVDILLIGYLLSASAVGIYNVALLLGGFVRLILTSFNQLFPTIASQLYAEDRNRELDAVYSAVARMTFTGALALSLVGAIYRVEILALFGAEYTRGSDVLVLFVASQLVASAVGPAGWLLIMTDHQYLFALDDWTLGSLNLGFSYYFILEFGLVGAALGTASALVIVNVFRTCQLWYFEGLFPFTADFGKPIVAGLGAGAVMYGLGAYVSGPLLLVTGTVIGWGLFGLLYYALGIPDTDVALFGALVARYRSRGGDVAERLRGEN